MTGRVPVLGDLRESVLRLLAPAGDVQLPSLSREELFALGDCPALAHTDDQKWWDGLSGSEQVLVRGTAERGLLARNLLRLPEGSDELELDEGVWTILAARRRPSWLAIMQGLDEPGAEVQVIVSGIDLSPGLTMAVLVRARIAGVHAHRLIAAPKAPGVMVDWLLREPTTGRVGSEPVTSAPVGRTVEILRPRDPGTDDQVRYARAVVLLAAGARVRWSRIHPDGTPGEPEPVTGPELTGWLAAACGLLGEPVPGEPMAAGAGR